VAGGAAVLQRQGDRSRGFQKQTWRGLDGATAVTGGMGQGRVRFNLFSFFILFYIFGYF